MDTVVALLAVLGALVLIFGVRGRGIWQAATTPDPVALDLNPLAGINLTPHITIPITIPNPFASPPTAPPMVGGGNQLGSQSGEATCGIPGYPPCP